MTLHLVRCTVVHQGQEFHLKREKPHDSIRERHLRCLRQRERRMLRAVTAETSSKNRGLSPRPADSPNIKDVQCNATILNDLEAFQEVKSQGCCCSEVEQLTLLHFLRELNLAFRKV
ncbi:hypothetical protein KC19_7G109600 [Ceratodon purpureus]|uniref:Uncharacterized protein n=1 Tax=Ceratodon purpureus TaxID=3225 RepID=A0A8T0H8G2_CERPU|nr:hypothetical protein KC19_7G109600 [Ceratodon purpureus]